MNGPHKTSVELYLQELVKADRCIRETFLHSPARVADEYHTQDEKDRMRDDAEQDNWLRVGALAMRRWIEIEEGKKLRYDPVTKCHHDFATLPPPCRTARSRAGRDVVNGRFRFRMVWWSRTRR